MITGWALENRQAIIYEVLLAVLHNERIRKADPAQRDLFDLLRVLMDDEHPVRCSTKQNLYAVLRKTAVWPKIKPFLSYNDDSCGRRGCQHGGYHHENGTGKCGGENYTGRRWSSPRIPCQCLEFVKKDFK